MAMCFFLLKQFDDVLIYMKSIKAYLFNDDEFNYNMGLAKCCTGHYKDAEEHLSIVQNVKYKMEYTYIMALARVYIFNGKPRMAWELYLKMETSHESFNLLQVCTRLIHPLLRPCELKELKARFARGSLLLAFRVHANMQACARAVDCQRLLQDGALLLLVKGV